MAEAIRTRHGEDLGRLDSAARSAYWGGTTRPRSAHAPPLPCALWRDDERRSAARFHLENGARLDALELPPTSDKGLAESLGVMVNYLYDLAAVEANHQRFLARRSVAGRCCRPSAGSSAKNPGRSP